MSDICISCEREPVFVTGMQHCRACLKKKVEADRVERERRWSRQRQQAAEETARRDWQRPLTDRDH